MANRIVRAQKISKEKRQRPGVTNKNSNKTSSTSYNNYKFNRNIDIERKQSLSAETYSSTNSAVQYATNDLIETQPVSRQHSTQMLDSIFTVDDDAQLFETPTGKNKIATATSAHILVGSNTLQYQHNKTTHRTGKKSLHLEKSIFVLKLTVKLPFQNSVPNHGHLNKVINLIP